MNKNLMIALALATSAAAGSALAADEPGSWYVSPLLQYTGLDSGRQAKDDIGGQLGVGYNLSREWAVEGNVGNGGFDRNSGTGSIQLQNFMVDGLRKFDLGSAVEPYLLVGAGALREKVTPDQSWATNFGAEAGGGVLVGLGDQTGASRVALRAEAKYRLDFVNSAAYTTSRPGDIVLGLGFLVSFGNAVAAAAPMHVAAPPPPPPPPPAVVAPPPPPPVPAPVAPPPPPPAPAAIHLESVYFATDKSVITPAAAKTLLADIDALRAHPGYVIAVAGNTDSRGSAEYNLGLSRRRLDAVEKFLKDRGVTNTLEAVANGEDKPVGDNKTADGQAKNRRVDLDLVGGK